MKQQQKYSITLKIKETIIVIIIIIIKKKRFFQFSKEENLLSYWNYNQSNWKTRFFYQLEVFWSNKKETPKSNKRITTYQCTRSNKEAETLGFAWLQLGVESCDWVSRMVYIGSRMNTNRREWQRWVSWFGRVERVSGFGEQERVSGLRRENKIGKIRNQK